MKFDFSIEASIEKIQNRNSKEYFIEVYQTFANGNYRSATVMLYSVLICDLVYKLRDLRDIYSDAIADSILKEVDKMQSSNPKSAEWENKLIDLIKTRTSLLEPSDHISIEALQKTRHLSAHPVLNNSDLLYSPNRDTVQALIRNILEGVLTNPPFFSNKILNTILDDLSDIKGTVTQMEDLARYLHSRYLSRLKINDFKKVVRSLWKIVFITEDSESRENGSINYRALRIFVASNKAACLELVKGENEFYSKIVQDEKVESLVHFLAYFPEFYSVLTEPLKILINQQLSNGGEIMFLGWFLNPSITEHLKKIDKENIHKISEQVFYEMLELARSNNCEDSVLNFGIDFFSSSSSFDETKNRYWNIILPSEEFFDVKHVERLLSASNKNSQILNCFGMKFKLKKIAEKFFEDLDTSLYHNLYD